MTKLMRPATEWEIEGILRDHHRRDRPLEVMGQATKRLIGRPVDTEVAISTASLRGVPLYEPGELVMSALAGTPLADVEAQLATKGQMLPFEPLDLGPVLGGLPAQGSIGGAFATNLSGPRRVHAGAARDHLLGIRAINGRAETFKAGGRVMKNVTGYDLCRALAGSWGTLAILTEVTFKVVPMPEDTATLAVLGLTDDIAAEVMSVAMGLPYEVSAAVHLPAAVAVRLSHRELRAQGGAVTALRIENQEKSVRYRIGELERELALYGESVVVSGDSSRAFWSELREISVMQDSTRPLWRISTAPTNGHRIVEALRRFTEVECYYDWAGGLVWLEVPGSADAGATDIRRVIASHGGHATLIRADEDVRAAIEVFQPLDPAEARISQDIKAAFDPQRLLNRGRMYSAL